MPPHKLPDETIKAMYLDYLRLKSLSKTGKLYGVTRQSMWDIFHRRGLKLQDRNFKRQRRYRGRTYTPGKSGYWRDTIFGRDKKPPGFEVQLHRRKWADKHGPIPKGCCIIFKDGNRDNCSLRNLQMLTHDEQQKQRGSKGENQFTVGASKRLALMLAGKAKQFLDLKKAA